MHKVKEEQTQIEGKVRNIKVELVECLETQCKGQDGLLQEQRERIRSLEADRDQVGPVKVRLGEVKLGHDVKGYMPSLGEAEAPGSLGLTQAPSMIVPECVQSASDMGAGHKNPDVECTKPMGVECTKRCRARIDPDGIDELSGRVAWAPRG